MNEMMHLQANRICCMYQIYQQIYHQDCYRNHLHYPTATAATAVPLAVAVLVALVVAATAATTAFIQAYFRQPFCSHFV